MPKNKDIIEPIDAGFDDVVEEIAQPAPSKSIKNNGLLSNKINQPAPRGQYILDLGIEIQRDVNGIEMGVLENGIPYLTQIGISKISGASRSVIFDITKEWGEHYHDKILGKDRISFLKKYLFSNGYTEEKLYIEIRVGGSPHYAYPDIVCMAILEYYAFESKSENKIATESYRKFAAYGLQKFIYDSLGYRPGDRWKYYHDRVSILKNSAPEGHFIIFNESTGLIVDLITAGLTVNDKVIPDGSVGGCWGRYWTDNNLNKKYGERIEYDHHYPEYYPQALSNPQKAKAYPDSALPEFRYWFRREYLITKFPSYILKKAHLLSGGSREADQIAKMYQPKNIEGQ